LERRLKKKKLDSLEKKASGGIKGKEKEDYGEKGRGMERGKGKVFQRFKSFSNVPSHLKRQQERRGGGKIASSLKGRRRGLYIRGEKETERKEGGER